MAAVSGIAVSVGSGTVAVGTAFLFISSASVTQAEITGPVDEEQSPLEYWECQYWVDAAQVAQQGNYMTLPTTDLDPDGNPYLNIDLQVNSEALKTLGINDIGIEAASNTNLKITLTDAGESENIMLSSIKTVGSATLWVTGLGNSLLVGQNTLTGDMKDIYVDSVGLNFAGSYQGSNELQSNFHLGASGYVDISGGGVLNKSTLIIGRAASNSDADAVGAGSSITVSTSGRLEIDESGATIGFNNGSQLMVKGVLTGEGDLTLLSEDDAPGRLYLLGGSSSFTGIISFGDRAGTRLYLGSSIELGGLDGSANNSMIGTDGVSNLTLTLNVAAGKEYSMRGSQTSNLSDRTWAAGIYLEKLGQGSQGLRNFTGSGVLMEKGSLWLHGTTEIGADGVLVNDGKLTFEGTSASFATGGNVTVQQGSLYFNSGTVNLRDVELSVMDGAIVTTEDDPVKDSKVAGAEGAILANVTLGTLNLQGGTVTLAGKTYLTYATLNLETGNLKLGGEIYGLSSTIEVGSDVRLSFIDSPVLDMSRFGTGETVADIANQRFIYKVDVVHVAENGFSVEGWKDVQMTNGYEALDPENGYYRAGVELTKAIIVQNSDTVSIDWRNSSRVEGTQMWRDGQGYSLALRLNDELKGNVGTDEVGSNDILYSVVFATGMDNAGNTLDGNNPGTRTPFNNGYDAYFCRQVENIFVDNHTEMVLRQASNRYVVGTSVGYDKDGYVQWSGKMMLMGTLTLRDKYVLNRTAAYRNHVESGPNALIVVDWANGIVGASMGAFTYDSDNGYNRNSPNYYIGNSDNIPSDYTGVLEVRTGVFQLNRGTNVDGTARTDAFSEVVVKSGGQVTILSGQGYDGSITLSGQGMLPATVGVVTNEVFKSAMALGAGVTVGSEGKKLTISDSAAVHINVSNGNGAKTATVASDLIGEGMGQFSFLRWANVTTNTNIARLVVRGNVQGIKMFNVDERAEIELVKDFDASQIDEETAESHRFYNMSGAGTLRFMGDFTGFDRATVEGNGTLELARSEKSFGSKLTTFTKDGAAYMNIYRDMDVSDVFTIRGGTVRFGDANNANYRFSAKRLEILNSCTFIITHAETKFNTDIYLSDGFLINGATLGNNATEHYFQFNSLIMSGSNSSISWSSDNAGNEGFAFERLTGNGDLRLGNMKKNPDSRQVFIIDEIVNYSGTLYTGILNTNNLRDTKRLVIGSVHQDREQNGAINMSGIADGDNFNASDYSNGFVSSSRFRKTGEGSFSINRLAVDTEVWMNYEGSMNVEELKFANNTVLHYTSADNDRVLLSSGVESDSNVRNLFIDILDLTDEQLALGVNLGFYANVENAAELFGQKLAVGGLAKGDYELYTLNGRLYLRATNGGVKLDWDRAMGAVSMIYAPTADELSKAVYGYTVNSDTWEGGIMALGDPTGNPAYVDSKANYTITRVKLLSSSGGKNATVIGGLHNTIDGAADRMEAQTFIYMAGGNYHMLVGGSSNSLDTVTVGGHIGGSHVQVEEGSVDYIVGGNHLSSGSYYFTGDSYISFRDGELKGGIVGGNTYSGNGGAFKGNSNIFIYTALANSTGETPTIGLPTAAAETAAPFTMVVGGSAYVSEAGRSNAITFEGNSKIVVNLSDYRGEDSFDKDLVGGNAYLSTKDTEDARVASWNTTFEGDSQITITGKNAAGENVLFEGMVVGASHHDQPGAVRINFIGDTNVSINGGQYVNAVMGGHYNGSFSTGNYNSVIEGDTNVTLYDGSFWRVTGSNYTESSGTRGFYQEGDSYVTIQGGEFSHDTQKTAAGKNAPAESYRSFAAGGAYIAGSLNGQDNAHEIEGSTNLLVTGGSFNGTVLVGGNFVSTSPLDGQVEYPNSSNIIRLGSNLDVSNATVTDGLLVGGTFLTDTVENGSSYIEGGSTLTIGEGATLTGSAKTALDGIVAVGGSYLDVASGGHEAAIDGGSAVVMTGGSVSGHIVGGSVLTGYTNTLDTDILSLSDKDALSVMLAGGSVKGNVYGGHYVGSKGNDARSSASTHAGSISVSLVGATITGNVYGGGSFSCGFGVGSSDYTQTQGAITVSLVSGTLSGDVYAAGLLGRPSKIAQNGTDAMQPDGARVSTESTRVELSSTFAFGKSATTVSGDYYMADPDFNAYNNEPIEGGRTLAFTDGGDYSQIKNWKGVTFIEFDTVEVVKGGNVKLSSTQFTPEETGFTKTGEGRLELEGALSAGSAVRIYGGTLAVGKQQDLSGGLHFAPSTFLTTNTPETAFLQGANGYTSGTVNVFLDYDENNVAELDSIGYGRYYLASNWDADAMTPVLQQWWSSRELSREFVLEETDNCLVLWVRENSIDPWLWRGITNHDRVKSGEWDSGCNANWNAEHMTPQVIGSPDGKSVLFTASAEGEVKVGELVHPSSVTVASGKYLFTQRSPDREEGIEGIWTDTLTVGGNVQAAELTLRLANRNINNIFLKNNGTLVLDDADAIVSSLERPQYNSIIYFQGGALVYGESFSKDISWQVSSQSADIVRIGVDGAHVDENTIVWGKISDSETTNTWAANSGISSVMHYGVEKTGEGSLRLQWGDKIGSGSFSSVNGHAHHVIDSVSDADIIGDITVQGGTLEFMPSDEGAAVDGFSAFRFMGDVFVADGATVVFSSERKSVVLVEGVLSGEGTVVVGRTLTTLDDDGETIEFKNTHSALGAIYCGGTGHSRWLPTDVCPSYVIGGQNSDFAGTIVLEGDSTRESNNYVQLGVRRNGTDRLNVSGFDKETRVMTALGGGQTTLVLAGRHLTTTGILQNGDHPEYDYDSNNQGGAVVDKDMSGVKYIRAGEVHVAEDTVNYIGSSCMDSETFNDRLVATSYRPWDNNYVFTGKLTGTGTLAIAWGARRQKACSGGNTYVGGYYTHELWGAIDEFEGWIVAGDAQTNRLDESNTNATWRFVASSASSDPEDQSIIRAGLAGAGNMVFEYTQDTVLEGVIGSATTGLTLMLHNVGSGKIIIGNSRNVSTGMLYVDGGGFELGDVDHYANWVGTDVRGTGVITLVNGVLSAPLMQLEGSSVTIRVETSSLGGTTVNAGRTKTKDLFEVIINKDGFLTGINGDLVAHRDNQFVKLVFSRNNVGTTAEGQHMIELGYHNKFEVKDASFFLMDFGVDSIVELLQEMASAPQASAYLHVLSMGSISIDRELWDDLLADGGSGSRLLSQLGLYIDDIQKGEIIMKSVGGKRAYYVFADAGLTDDHVVDRYDILSKYEAVIVQRGQTLDIRLSGSPDYGTGDYNAGGAVVPNLTGEQGAFVKVTNTNPNRDYVNVIFRNSDSDDKALDTVFGGTITGDDYVNFVKTGGGTLTVGTHDAYSTSGGFNGHSLDIREGGMVLCGGTNEVRDTLSFSYETESDVNGLTLLNGVTTVGKLVEKGNYAGPIILGDGARLNITADYTCDWADIVVMRESEQSTGFLTLQQGKVNLVSTEKAQLQGVHLSLQDNAQLSISRLEDVSLASLDGDGMFTANVSGALEVLNSANTVFSGTLASGDDVQNTLHLAKGAGMMTMRNVKNPGNWSIHNDGKLMLDVSGRDSSLAANNNMHFSNLTLGATSETTYKINMDHLVGSKISEMLTTDSITVEAGATMLVDTTGSSSLFSGMELTIAEVGAGSSVRGLNVELKGFSFILNESAGVEVDALGNMKLRLTERSESGWLHANQEANAASGAHLLWAALHDPKATTDAAEDLRSLAEYVMDDCRADQGARDKALAAGAGASIAALGPALAQDMQRQLRAIRNRTTTMGSNQAMAVGAEPTYHAWINAEGNYHKMESDGLAPGFSLSSWGGTVGMDVDVSSRTTLGLALTAMYGTLTANAADKADGKMDTYYLNFFAKTHRGNWMHTFVGSIGLATVNLDRTINMGTKGTIETSGSTNGYGLGLMYELGYSVPMNSEASYAIQPVVNVTLRHVGVSGYEESGHGAELRVGDITQTIFTIGAGVRAQAVVGENSYNRASILEGRILAKVDAGDTKGETSNAFVQGSSLSASVESAEVGAVGLEVGVGITIPMDNSKGSIFIDASAELRSGYTNMNATVGYRLDF